MFAVLEHLRLAFRGKPLEPFNESRPRFRMEADASEELGFEATDRMAGRKQILTDLPFIDDRLLGIWKLHLLVGSVRITIAFSGAPRGATRALHGA
jgi:hypothetical protein